MVKKTREEALETRKNILTAAIEVFYEKGVANASLNEIAEQAGVTRGAIYWHFKNKLDVFEALHDDLQQSFVETVITDLETDHPEPLKQLEQLCVALLTDLETNHSKRKILSVFFLKCDYSGEMAKFLVQQNANKQKSLTLFSQYFERARKQGVLEPGVDPQVLALSLTFYLSGIVQEHLRDPAPCDLTCHAAQFIRQFFHGVYAAS